MAYRLLKEIIDPVYLILFFNLYIFFAAFKKVQKRYIRLFLGLPFIVLYTTSISPVSNVFCYFLEKEYLSNQSSNIEKLEVVVVLGGGAYNIKNLKKTLPTLQTSSRILHAVQVFKETKAEYLICSGKGMADISEAEVMCNIAERSGVSRAMIKIDSGSCNTWEHAQTLDKMFHEKDLKIGIVTSAYHMKRSEMEFKKHFYHVIPFPSDYLYSPSRLSIFTFLPSSANLSRFSIALHEIVGIAWYKLKDRL